MRKFGKIIECVAAAGMFCCATACSNEDWPVVGGWYTENYIVSYLIPDKFSSYSRLGTGEVFFDIDGKFTIWKGDAEFDAIAERNNDLSYDRWQGEWITALYDGVTGLSIVTVDYFDEAHPAGSDISDIVDCKYQTYYEYIQGGYEYLELNWEPPYLHNYGPVTTTYEMGLSEVNYDNCQVMDPEIIIWFTSEPEEPGVYEFRFRVDLPNTWFRETFYYEFK